MISPELYLFDSVGLYHKANAVASDLVAEAVRVYQSNYEAFTRPYPTKVKGFETHKIFLDLLTQPAVHEICRVCYGPAYRLDHLHLAEQNQQTTKKPDLHGEFFGRFQSHYYLSSPQRHIRKPCYTRVGQLSVGVVLQGQDKATGGFCYIPGSHKSAYHLTGAELMNSVFSNPQVRKNTVTVPDLAPGDVIAFPENLIHGHTVMTTKTHRLFLYGMYFPYSISYKYNNPQIDALLSIADENQKIFLTRNIEEMNYESYKFRPEVRPNHEWQ